MYSNSFRAQGDMSVNLELQKKHVKGVNFLIKHCVNFIHSQGNVQT